MIEFVSSPGQTYVRMWIFFSLTMVMIFFPRYVKPKMKKYPSAALIHPRYNFPQIHEVHKQVIDSSISVSS